MRLKVVSDGTRMGTYVVDLETGRPVVGVSWLSYSIGVHGPARLTVEFVDGMEVDVEGDPVVVRPEKPRRSLWARLRQKWADFWEGTDAEIS